LVPVSVVDLLQAVDVDEGEREPLTRPAGTLDVAVQLDKAELSGPRARYFVSRGELEVVLGFDARTLSRGTLNSCRLPVGGGPETVFGCLGPISCRSRAVALGL
jgi:hypothetical protein